MQSINDLKRALLEVKKICLLSVCNLQCPFYSPMLDKCPMGEELCPEDWPAYVWDLSETPEVDENATD